MTPRPSRSHVSRPIVRLARALGAALLATLGACHPAASVHGALVREPDRSAGGDRAAVLPAVRDAIVTVRCPTPPGAQRLTGRSDAAGLFYVNMESRFHRRCALEVDAAGFAPVRLELGSVCGSDPDAPAGEYCPTDTTLVLQLHRAAP